MRGPVPIVVDVAGRVVLCVGGGPVAAAKCRPFADAGARLVLVAPEVDPAFDEDDVLVAALADVRQRDFEPGDLEASADGDLGRPALVLAATASDEVNEAVGAAAADRGTWCIRVDAGAAGTAALPAVVRRGPVQIAISSGGASPAFTAALRHRLEEVVDDRWGEVAALLGELRADPEVQAALGGLPQPARADRWRAVVAALLDDPVAGVHADEATARQLLLDPLDASGHPRT